MNFVMTFAAPAYVTGSPRLQLDVGGTIRYATYLSGSGSNNLTFRYSPQSGDLDADGVDSVGTALDLNGGTIEDENGNSATLTLPAPGEANSLGAGKSIAIDAEVPAARMSPARTGSTFASLRRNAVSSAGVICVGMLFTPRF